MLDLNYKLECIKRLKAGYKVLVMGNHDKGASNYKRKIEKNVQVCPECGSTNIKIEVSYDDDNYIGFIHEDIDISCPDCGHENYYHDDRDRLVEDGYIKTFDNNLFDEVYEGTLQIGPKLFLSHEPMYDSFYYLNIHGHVHGEPFGYYDHYIIDSEDDETGELAGTEVYGNWFNVIAEGMNFEPISLKNILKQVSLKNIVDIHRETIDKAIQSNTKNVEKA